jgi:predicted dehydrogenase
MKRVGVVGYGYWGPNLVRNFLSHPDFELIWICDSNPGSQERCRRDYHGVTVFGDLESALATGELDLVAVATPPHTHHELALQVIAAGVNLLMEKPLTLDSASGREIVLAAEAAGVTVFVDQTYLFTPAAERVRDLIAEGSLGSITMYDSTRMSLGLIQTETNVIWDLAIHDCALMLYWFDELPVQVSCTGVVVHPSEVTAAAHLSCTFASGLFAHVGVSWLSPVKKRSIVLTGDERMLVFDDIEPTEKIRVYDSRASVQMDEGQRKIQYRMGDIVIPHVLQREALSNELSEISACLDGRGTPRSDAKFALGLSLILEAADRSMAHGGTPQKVMI